MVTARWSERWLIGWGTILILVGAVAAEAANCGDTAGPGRSRVPCACFDTVVTSTRLRPTDPIAGVACEGPESVALTLGRDNITLDCRGLTIEGSSQTASGEPGMGGRGIFGERSGVTVKNCAVESFLDGILLKGNRNRIVDNTVVQALDAISVEGDDNALVDNQVLALFAGLSIDGGRRNVVANNRSSGSGLGLFVNGHGGWIFGNTFANSDDAGVIVEGSRNVLFANEANDNAARGICAEPANVNGGLNRARGNGQAPQVDFDCEIPLPPAD
jgi:hypothetical protein